MDNLDDLDCPQYVSFQKMLAQNDSSIESSPCSSVKHDQSVDMDIEDDNIHQENRSTIEYVQSKTYLDGSTYQKDLGFSPASSEYLVEDFPVNRPKNLSLPEKPEERVGKGTKVKPFKLTEDKKRKREDEHIPLAEQVAAFQKKTPQRFHTTGPRGFQPTKHWSPPVIHPKSPVLHAAKRIRGVNVPSREELEEKEAEEMKRYKFRARPINKKILERRQSLKFGKKTPTKPRGLHLRTAERAAQMYNRKKDDEKPYEFHAQPVPKSILSGPTGLKEKPVLPVTEAKTPNFALKSRLEKWRSAAKMNETNVETQVFKALPAPVNNAPFAVKHEKKRTEIKPFSFDHKDKERLIQKEQKIREEIEKENSVYVFKAQPMPSPAPSLLPAVPKKPLTMPEPFNFLLEQKSFKDCFDISAEQLCTTFKAQPATVLKKAPFIPEKPPKASFEVKEFQLHTGVRAVERQKLKEINDMKEHEKELAYLRFKELQEKEERKEIMKLRKEIVHKANPIRHFKPVEIKPSDKIPTEPVSPKFKTDERLQLRHSAV